MSETESDIAASDIVASTSSSTSGSASASTEITEPHQADHVVASACSSALLDGKFFRIIKVDKDNGAVKAVCVWTVPMENDHCLVRSLLPRTF